MIMSAICQEVIKVSKKSVGTGAKILCVRCFSNARSPNGSNEYDVVVVGGGIVGAATARELLLRHGNLRMAIVEKESRLAVHQSGHNSGVIHAGIYYQPGSLKAKLCVEGMGLIYDYCDSKGIPYKKVGKLIVATNPLEVKRLGDLKERGLKNKVKDLQHLKSQEEIRKIEPYCHGLEALWSPHTGIIDYVQVTESYGEDFKKGGGDIHLNFKVNGFVDSNNNSRPVTITSEGKASVTAKYVLTCGGLHSDVIAELSGCSPDPKIVPFRGEYLLLNPDKCHMIKGNIYPVPDPRFPFLGVHFTPRMDGSVWLGPNAVLAWKREGYTYADMNIKELIDAISYRGFQKLAYKHVGYGIQEMIKSIVTRLQVKDLQKYIPEITAADIKRGPAGVRAQALGINGNLVDDFHFDLGKGNVGARILHCRNAPSPGATSSLAIAKMMADKVEEQFNLSQLKA